jgi:hypothetical protein
MGRMRERTLRWAAALPQFLLVAVASAADSRAVAQSGVFTYHNDVGRTGQNTSETVLTPATVNSARFGKLFSQAVDGDVYAQPLYMRRVAIAPKGTHNVVFVATEGDGVYAFDADNAPGTEPDLLWHVSLIDAAHGASADATPVDASADLHCAAISPQVGITATPVIDPARAVFYVEAFSKENGAFVHRLHALDLGTGAEKPGSPTVIRVPAKEGASLFEPVRQLSRAGLLLSKGVIYVTYGGHCDKTPYHGWVFAFDALSLAPRGDFVAAPGHGKAGIWMSGAAPAADERGNVYLATGDGWFDTEAVPAREFGNSVLKLAVGKRGLSVKDYFTPFDQARFARHDGDLGSGGVLLLPDQPGARAHLLVAVGKSGTLYLADRDTMTAGNLHYCSGCASDRQIAEEIPDAISGGVWGMPSYWHDTVFVSGSGDVLRAFSLAEGRLSATPVSVSRDVCEYPGCGSSVSANGDMNGILWAVTSGGDDMNGAAVLRAYDAQNLAFLLYSSNQHDARDDAGKSVKFAIPTVGDGRVYVGGARHWSAFGLL